MKYALAALAVAAAIAAWFFRPPGATPAAPAPLAAAFTSPPARPHAAPTFAAQRIIVYVAGEVADPGVYTFAPGERADAALRRAGGPKVDADLVAVNLAAPLEDGEEVAIPKIGESAAARGRGARSARAHTPATAHRRRGHRAHKSGPADPGAAIDLNAADAHELERLPGVGPDLAERIVAFRDLNGPFSSLDELGDVNGISDRLAEQLTPYLVIGPGARSR